MEQIPPPKEVKILETAEDIQERREQVWRIFIGFRSSLNIMTHAIYIFPKLSLTFLYLKKDYV